MSSVLSEKHIWCEVDLVYLTRGVCFMSSVLSEKYILCEVDLVYLTRGICFMSSVLSCTFKVSLCSFSAISRYT